MAKDQNFDNNGQEFNITLEDSGDLSFKANGKNGAGNTRMVIADNSGEVAIGGSGEFGQVQLKSPLNANTVFLGASSTEANATLGGTGGISGRVQLFDGSGHRTVDLNGSTGGATLGAAGSTDGDLSILGSGGTTTIRMNGEDGRLELFGAGGKRADLQGGTGRLQLLNGQGVVTADLRGDAGILTLGGASATGGDLFMLDTAGSVTIVGNGETGHLECVTLTETSAQREAVRAGRKGQVVSLGNALDNVLALRGVRYQRKNGTASRAAAAGDAQQIGFVGQEVEAVCPELVATDADGYKSVSYSRMTAVLVEAVKEQQQMIREQAAALAEALRKISTIEAGLAAHQGMQGG